MLICSVPPIYKYGIDTCENGINVNSAQRNGHGHGQPEDP